MVGRGFISSTFFHLRLSISEQKRFHSLTISQLLGSLPLINSDSNRRYLLDKTQHLVGGFGKKAGDPPDVYHSFLGLAALSVMALEPDLKPIDATTCFSLDACKHLAGLEWRREIWNEDDVY
jgi:geranylgeranyl transferase type-1 subunit beta